MTGEQVEDFEARLHQLAADVLLHRGDVAARAVQLCCNLIIAGRHTPAVVEVAALPPDTTFGDAEQPLRSMLAEQGLQLPMFQTQEDRFAALRTAFGFWGLPLDKFEGPFYERLPAWDSQDPLDRTLVIMLDQLDHETDPLRRNELVWTLT